jgi:hypothetical protein
VTYDPAFQVAPVWHAEPEVLFPISGDKTRKHAVVTHAGGLFTCVIPIYLTSFSIAGIALSNDKLICEYRDESHVADRGRELI